MMSRKIAVVLFNLGGPDQPSAVRPFLFNLFNDPAIIRVPWPFRWLLAQLISRKRAPEATAIYANLGGGSPLLPNTKLQAAALKTALADLGMVETFIAMRYWHPMTPEAIEAVKRFDPDEVVLLPLYPQYSTTTSASSLALWDRMAKRAGLAVPTRTVCCWPVNVGLVQAVADLVRDGLLQAAEYGKPRVLFSAHGLPEKIVAAGDPYQWQVEQTVAAVLDTLDMPDLESVVCYQSRVGPLKWIGPATDEEVERAGVDRRSIVMVPIAFVSEHSETLVELDIEYRELAEACGVPAYHRVRTVDVDRTFVEGLASVVRGALARTSGTCPEGGVRLCPARWTGCPASSA